MCSLFHLMLSPTLSSAIEATGEDSEARSGDGGRWATLPSGHIVLCGGGYPKEQLQPVTVSSPNATTFPACCFFLAAVSEAAQPAPLCPLEGPSGTSSIQQNRERQDRASC